MASLKSLSGMANITVRTKANGERRRTVSVQDKLGKELADANTPIDMGKLAMKFGINEDEILTRAKSSPNFGQFRMVLGNRIRGISRRMKENPGTSFKDAAYPPKKQRAVSSSGKKVVKKVTKVSKKTAKSSVGGVSGSGRHPAVNSALLDPLTPTEAERWAIQFSVVMERTGREYTDLTAAQGALRSVGTDEHVLVRGPDGRIALIHTKPDGKVLMSSGVKNVKKVVGISL